MQRKTVFDKFGILLDCSRNAVMTVEMLKNWIDIMADLGYNTLMLYTEDTYEVDNQPYFGYLRGRYSQKELREIDEYAFEKGIELIPAIQTLAHLNSIFRWPVYRKINDCNDILLAGDDKTYQLIAVALFSSKLAHGVTDSERIKNGFYEKFGITFDDFMLTELLGTPNEKKNDILNPEKYMLYNGIGKNIKLQLGIA